MQQSETIDETLTRLKMQEHMLRVGVKLVLENCPSCKKANLEANTHIPQWGGNRIYVPGLERSCPKCGFNPND